MHDDPGDENVAGIVSAERGQSMRKLMVVVGLTAVLLMALAVPALAGGDGLLGSGEVPPVDHKGGADVEHVATADVSTVSGGSLAATGLDSGALLLVGLGLAAAGGAAVFTARRYATR
jgi:LPXTG-motif cell wall-anchored protein